MELSKSDLLKKEYKEFSEKLLPKVLEWGYCNVIHCKHHSKFDMLCSLCREAKCNHCRQFNLSKDILLGSANTETKLYLHNYIADFLNLSDESLKHHFPDIKIEKIQKVNCTKRGKSEKNRTQVVNQVLPQNLCSGQFQHGR